MIPQNISLKDHYKGDTFKGVAFELTKNNSPIDITDTEIRCQFIKNQGPIVQTITLDDHIEITNASEGKFRINPFIIDWDPAMYFFDIQFIFTGNIIQTYVRGSLVVQKDITQNG